MSDENERSGKEIREMVSRVASRLRPCPRCGREHACLPDDPTDSLRGEDCICGGVNEMDTNPECLADHGGSL